MLDIINKKNAFIASAAVLLLCAFMLLMIGIVTLGKGCIEQPFDVKTLEDGSKTLVATIDGAEVTPKNLDKMELTGESMTLWYNPVDNVIIEHYFVQSWGCLGAGIVLALTGTLILVNGFRKKQLG